MYDFVIVGAGFGEINHWEDKVLDPAYNGDEGEFNRSNYKTVYIGPRIDHQKPELIYTTPHVKEIGKKFGLKIVNTNNVNIIVFQKI